MIVSWDWTQAQRYYSSIFSLFFFLALFCMLALKICVTVFSGTNEARVLKHGVYKDNE